ncbi:hypothetical protein [Chitinophaga tropicalis]|uniref:Uncharacterized protein n=1 Tax=Chitinophaga tropicalis TaxID=2683588 RepID=A0A7K1U863_9BACT|nr:hypothetical protein [Chitinophaga tropicalis]MVT10564.1 hypothetical protein [Chitinophaga tropicalis]
MTSDLAEFVIEQLKIAREDKEVEAVIAASVKDVNGGSKGYFNKLEEVIGRISPLDCNSRQWRNFRVALICLRNQAMRAVEA